MKPKHIYDLGENYVVDYQLSKGRIIHILIYKHDNWEKIRDTMEIFQHFRDGSMWGYDWYDYNARVLTYYYELVEQDEIDCMEKWIGQLRTKEKCKNLMDYLKINAIEYEGN